ncbi:Uncharacterised protein [Serratia fonticola]|uniref:Uncharacterized protein n=1 Tax=Serratia fonticola TaxID=47917 RepID=A0A4U9TIU7_SERFO|nr:Uncharacterised protein [Serratia fonticola]
MGRAINHRRIEMGGNQWLMGAIQMRGRPSLMCRVAFGIVMVIGSELLCGSFAESRCSCVTLLSRCEERSITGASRWGVTSG